MKPVFQYSGKMHQPIAIPAQVETPTISPVLIFEAALPFVPFEGWDFQTPHATKHISTSPEELPSRMLLRPAEPADALAVARLHVRSWQSAYRGLMPDDYLAQLRPEDRAQRYNFAHVDPLQPHTIVALTGTTIHGFATTMPARDSDLFGYGELAALYVDPDYWNQGFGLALITAARAHLVTQEFRNAILWVLEGNSRAEHFYRKDRWKPDGQSRKIEIWGIEVNESRYKRSLLL